MTTKRAVVIRAVGVLLLVLAVASTTSGVVATVREREQVACQGRVNGELSQILAQLSKALAERSDAAAAAQQSQRDFLGALLDPKGTPQSKRDAFDTYYAGLQKSDATRAAYPLPTSNATTCQ